MWLVRPAFAWFQRAVNATTCSCVAQGLQGVASGAIASDYQRLRVEAVCGRLGLTSLAYLWHQPQA